MRLAPLLVASLLLTATHVWSKDAGPAPEIIGRYGASPEQCRAFHRKDAGLTIGPGSWKFDEGPAGISEAHIVGAQRVGSAIALSLKTSDARPAQRIVHLIDDGVIEIEGTHPSATRRTLVRCRPADAVAGIGLDTIPTGQTKAMNAVFAAAYAKAVPGTCPGLKASTGTADHVVWLGRQAWLKYLVERGLTPYGPASYEQDVQRTVTRTEARARDAVAADARVIDGFCDRVLEAFGPNGRIIPKLITDPRLPI